MSITSLHDVACDCGATLTVTVCDSLNPERHPHLRRALMERTLHLFTCDGCFRQLHVDKQMTYIDLGRKQFYAVGLQQERSEERSLGEQLASAWKIALGDQAPNSTRELFGSREFHVRLCFGLEELREKIIAREAGLSDLVLESLKGDLMAMHPEWIESGVRTLRLDHIEPDGRLAFLFEQASEPSSILEGGLLIERADYESHAQIGWQALLENKPWLASGPHVSVLRLAIPDVLAAAENVH